MSTIFMYFVIHILYSVDFISATKRNVIEKRIEFRLQTLDKFNQIHEESLSRRYEQMLQQNQAAKQRNHNILCQLGAGKS